MSQAPTIELAPGVALQILASGSTGAVGLTTSFAIFQPNSELPCHRHPMDEAILVIAGEAFVCCEGRRYRLRPFDSIHVPAGTPHSVRNASIDNIAVLHTSFPSDAPTREMVADEFSMQEFDDASPDSPERLTRYARSDP